jgi:hypothetical protein
MIMVKNSRITDWLMSRMLTLASASTFAMPAMMPTRSEPIMVMMARPVCGVPASFVLFGMVRLFKTMFAEPIAIRAAQGYRRHKCAGGRPPLAAERQDFAIANGKRTLREC